MVDKAFVVIGEWNGKREVWRAGVYDDEQQAKDEWNLYISDWVQPRMGCPPPKFISVKEIDAS